jgi:DNA-binding transcriptional regulator YiaG
MLIALHKNATTTPAIRAAIRNAKGSDYGFARQFGVTRDTIRKWGNRESVQEASHTAHWLQTTLNAA